jgi:pimeloyl-ACP methyl ester carboxylesterase
MNYIKSKGAQPGEEVNLYYEDLGYGQPVVFVHGWPLSQEMWEYQVTELVKQGLRCITYDRRGFGKSSRPLGGYDYDTLADDLKSVLDALELEDVILVGFSMGGGEVARYFGRHGGRRVSKAVLVSSVTPYMMKSKGNEDGVDENVFVEMLAKMKIDRIGFLDDFGRQFFSAGFINHPVSTPLLDYYRTLASFASPIATQECVKAFAQTDFRQDLLAIDVPTLIIHGDNDKIVPIEVSGNKTAQLINGNKYVIYPEAPHGLFYTHRVELNEDIVSFINGEPLVEEMEVHGSVMLPTNYPI